MRKVVLLALLVCCPVLGAVAQSPFDGTWKYDTKTIQWLPTQSMPQGSARSQVLLHDGYFDYQRSKPPIKVKADGTDHAVAGFTDRDAANVNVPDDHNLEVTYKKDGKVVLVDKWAVSNDGNTFTLSTTDDRGTETKHGKMTFQRTGPGPAGTHLVNGGWRAIALETDHPPVQSYTITGDQVTMSFPDGTSYTAKLDGSKAPYQGDSQVDTVSVRLFGRTLEERLTKNGEVVIINTMTVSDDGQSMNITNDQGTRGPLVKIVARKQ